MCRPRWRASFRVASRSRAKLGFSRRVIWRSPSSRYRETRQVDGRRPQWILRNWRSAAAVAAVILSFAAAAASWFPRGADPPAVDFAKAKFTLFTNWAGAEEGAEISPNGELVAFLSDLDGEFDLWVSQVGTGFFHNLTRDIPPLAPSGFIWT